VLTRIKVPERSEGFLYRAKLAITVLIVIANESEVKLFFKCDIIKMMKIACPPKPWRRWEEKLPGVQKNIPLSRFTTFRIGGKARYFFDAKTKEDIIKALKAAKELGLPFFILGAGSNVLVSDKGFDGLVIKIRNSKLEIKNFDDEFNFICDAGVSLAKIVSETLKLSATGFEWAAGIPGALGGAIYGNAGAFGKSMRDSIETVEVYKLDNDDVLILQNKDCEFNYRESIFKKNKELIIISAVLNFKKGDRDRIEKEIKEKI